jgi:hypothetical protein
MKAEDEFYFMRRSTLKGYLSVLSFEPKQFLWVRDVGSFIIFPALSQGFVQYAVSENRTSLIKSPSFRTAYMKKYDK